MRLIQVYRSKSCVHFSGKTFELMSYSRAMASTVRASIVAVVVVVVVIVIVVHSYFKTLLLLHYLINSIDTHTQ